MRHRTESSSQKEKTEAVAYRSGSRRRTSTPDDRTQDELVGSPTYMTSASQPYNQDHSMPLYTIDQVPHYLRDNRYVIAGYRAYYSTSMCIRSLFYLHNETFNIWTHLIGGIVFIFLTFELFYQVLIPEYHRGNVFSNGSGSGDAHKKRVRLQGEHTLWPFLIFGFYSFSCLMCMLCSACFHTFIAHMSERFYHWAHALDYFGITFLVVGSFIPFCYYCFSCEPAWRNTYVIMISCFGAVGLLGPFFRRWTSVAFATKKILFYVCMVGSGLLPIGHMAFFQHTGEGSPYVGGLMTMMSLYGIGVFIYAFKIPEIFFPGKFDVFFSSHQIWHVCVLGAALTHFFNCVSMYVNFENMSCSPAPV